MTAVTAGAVALSCGLGGGLAEAQSGNWRVLTLDDFQILADGSARVQFSTGQQFKISPGQWQAQGGQIAASPAAIATIQSQASSGGGSSGSALSGSASTGVTASGTGADLGWLGWTLAGLGGTVAAGSAVYLLSNSQTTAQQASTTVATTTPTVATGPVFSTQYGGLVEEYSTTVLSTISATSANANDTVTLKFGTGGGDEEWFAFDTTTGQLKFLYTPNFEAPKDDDRDNVYEAEIIATNSAGLATATVARYQVVDIDETDPTVDPAVWGGGSLSFDPPVITSNAAVSIVEGVNSVIQVTATAVKDEGRADRTLYFDIMGGVDAALFSIDVLSGVVSFRAASDFAQPKDVGADNVYSLTIGVDDGITKPVTQDLTIRVQDSATAARQFLTASADTNANAALSQGAFGGNFLDDTAGVSASHGQMQMLTPMPTPIPADWHWGFGAEKWDGGDGYGNGSDDGHDSSLGPMTAPFDLWGGI